MKWRYQLRQFIASFNHRNLSHHEDRSWGTSPGWAARFFIKSAKSARSLSCRLTCCDSGNQSSRFSSLRKVAEINDSTSGKKLKQCWKSSACSMRKGTHLPVSNAIRSEEHTSELQS